MTHYLLTLISIGGIYLLMAQALNFQYGFSGLANFGVVGFFATGAYCSAVLTLYGLPVAAGIAAGAVLAGILGLVISTLCLGLRSDYLAIVTLGFSETVRITAVSEEWLTNGTRGLAGIPSMSLPILDANVANAAIIVTANVVVAVGLVLLIKSPFGRTIRAVRDDEIAVEAIGKMPLAFKRRVFALGSAIIGVAGALYGHYIGYISPDQFLPLTTFYVWIAVIMGGAGRLSGPLLGALILTLFLEGSRFSRDFAIGISEVEMASIRFSIIGFALIALAIWRPQGLLGDYTKK
ncbi:branched-chain amino acid ABC transporter permease [Pseudochelatococcus sp. B33]